MQGYRERNPHFATRLAAATLMLATFLGCLATMPGASAAAVPDLFTRFPRDSVGGSEAGRLGNPRGIAANSKNGHVYVVDRINARIGEYTAWGNFVKAWGWDVAPDGAEGDTPADKLEICTTVCQVGLKGNGAGQFSEAYGIAADSGGNVFVYESNSYRVQKFSPEGDFLFMFGGGVNNGTGNPNICTNAGPPTDICGSGSKGTNEGEFSNTGNTTYLAYNSVTDSIFVGDKARIQEFGTDGVFLDAIELTDLNAIDSEIPAEGTISVLSTDGEGDLYFGLQDGNVVYKVSESGLPLEPTFTVPLMPSIFSPLGPRSVAVSSVGRVYIASDPSPNFGIPELEASVLEFDSSGQCLNCAPNGEDGGDGFDRGSGDAKLNGVAVNEACGVSDAYVTHFAGSQSNVNAYGPTPDPEICEPPPVPPEIDGQYAVSVDAESAVLRAEINPRFWPDTTYFVEYGVEPCVSGGCQSKPVSPSVLGGKAVNFALVTPGVFLTDLTPETTYYFRFVAQSSGGGPVRGVGGTVESDGVEGSFTTFPLSPELTTQCPNQAFRTGSSATLPNCRAYEMVTPIDKNGGDVFRLSAGASAELEQSSVDGKRFAYLSQQAFAEPKSAAAVSQYLAERDPKGGWVSEALSTPRGLTQLNANESLRPQYKAFTTDLCQAWLRHDTDPALTPDAPASFANLYHRDNCTNGGFEVLNKIEPPATKSKDFLMELQGVSKDGNCAVFRANDALTEDAAGGAGFQVYENCNGQVRLISVLPNGTASKLGNSVGVAGPERDNRQDSVWNAVSSDGSTVYWTAALTSTGTGKLYVRLVDREETVAVSEAVSKADARFWGASWDGSRAIFSIGASLYGFDLQSEAAAPIAQRVEGVLGMSGDASRLYFVSREDLAVGATEGDPNIYLCESSLSGECSFTFVAALSDRELSQSANVRNPVSQLPSMRASRVSPDGQNIVFMSISAELSEQSAGYDNTDAESGEPDAEVYVYSAEKGELNCVSCNPSGARPSGRRLEVGENGKFHLWAASQIPTWNSQLYPGRVLADDGQRLFFESFEALVTRDTNGRQDVYEWERAEGKAECKVLGAELYVKSAGGCLSLISSGQSAQDSKFLDASPNGSDVFFVTGSSLVAHDPGLVDIYDARVGGGFPPIKEIVECEGEACQGLPAPPNDPTPASSTFNGAGNMAKDPKARCGKGKRLVRKAGKTRCVNKKKKRKRQAGHKRRVRR